MVQGRHVAMLRIERYLIQAPKADAGDRTVPCLEGEANQRALHRVAVDDPLVVRL